MQLKIKSIKKNTKDTFSLILEKPKNFNFYPGQFLDIELPVNDPIGQTRVLSISSSPSEDFVMLTYKKGISAFKKRLELLRVGDIVQSSHPAGTVVIDDSSHIVFMAGGIGIAPHRSMLKWAIDQKLSLPIILIYSNSDPDFIFKKELDLWIKEYPKLTIHYVITGKEGRLTQEKLRSIVNFPLSIVNSIFYLAGPPSLVDDFEKILLDLGIDETSIRTDRFEGL